MSSDALPLIRELTRVAGAGERHGAVRVWAWHAPGLFTSVARVIRRAEPAHHDSLAAVRRCLPEVGTRGFVWFDEDPRNEGIGPDLVAPIATNVYEVRGAGALGREELDPWLGPGGWLYADTPGVLQDRNLSKPRLRAAAAAERFEGADGRVLLDVFFDCSDWRLMVKAD